MSLQFFMRTLFFVLKEVLFLNLISLLHFREVSSVMCNTNFCVLDIIYALLASNVLQEKANWFLWNVYTYCFASSGHCFKFSDFIDAKSFGTSIFSALSCLVIFCSLSWFICQRLMGDSTSVQLVWTSWPRLLKLFLQWLCFVFRYSMNFIIIEVLFTQSFRFFLDYMHTFYFHYDVCNPWN